MAVPFKSTVFTGGSFAASGSNGHGSAGLLIYSASRSSSGLLPSADLAAVGSDVFLFVSGVLGSRGTAKPGTTLIGGDLVVSGTAYDGSGNPIGGGPVYFTSPSAGVVQTTGSITALGTLRAGTGIQASGSSGITGSLVIKDDIAEKAQLTLSSSAGNIAFDYYSDGNLYVTNNRISGEYWFSATQPDGFGSQFFRAKPQNSGRNLVIFNGSLVGSDAANPENSSDTVFFVNGVTGSRGTATRGTAVFGGDLYVSGTMFASELKTTIISSSIIYKSGSTLFGDSLDDTHTFIGGITGSDLRLSGDIAVNGGDITSTALSPTLFNTSNNNALEIGRYLTSLTVGDQSTGTAFTMNVGANRSGNFTLNMGTAVATGATKTVNIATNAGLGSITNITLGSDTAGTSGTTFLKTPKVEISGRAQVTGSLVAPFITGSLTTLVNGTSYLAAGSNVTITTGSTGQVTISAAGGGSSSPTFFISTTAGSVYSTGSLALVGDEAGVDSPQDKGVDNFFYVSGSIGKRGTAQGRNALFGGDVVVSGSQYVSGTFYIGQSGAYLRYTSGSGASVSILDISSPAYVNVTSYNGTTFYPGGTFGVLGAADIQLAAEGSSGFYFLNSADTDTTKYLLKITDPADLFTPTIDFGNSSSGTSQFNFYGEIYAREVIRAETSIVVGDTVEARVVTASYGLTGSLTRLSDGRSYLVAGSNVTITSQSNGQVTISSTGGSGSPAGSNTYVQFNDSGSFGASSALSFEKANGTLSATNLTIGGNFDTQAVDSRWYLRDNSADSLSFWDGTSGSRRFQIKMGDSQERFISYDGSGFAAGNDKDLEILHDGTDSYVKNSTGKLYVSGSTSGVFVTGSAGLIVADGVLPTLTVRASTDSTNQAVFYQESEGDTYVSNQKNSGKFFSSVKTSGGVAVRYLRAIPNAINYNTIVSFVQGLHDFFDPQTNTTDVNFYVGGKAGSKGTTGQRGTALFAGDMVVSGSTHMQNGGSITGSFSIQGSIIPSADSTYTLGTDTLRWGHVYTGDLHLRNERGDWTILEEPDYLCVINNRTGKKYKMMLQPID